MNNRQRDEFYPTCAALRTAAISAVGVGRYDDHWDYSDTATATVQGLTIPILLRLSF